jgi:hypothetical protein
VSFFICSVFYNFGEARVYGLFRDKWGKMVNSQLEMFPKWGGKPLLRFAQMFASNCIPISIYITEKNVRPIER